MIAYSSNIEETRHRSFIVVLISSEANQSPRLTVPLTPRLLQHFVLRNDSDRRLALCIANVPDEYMSYLLG